MLRSFVAFSKLDPTSMGTQVMARPICIHALIPASGSGGMKDVWRKRP